MQESTIQNVPRMLTIRETARTGVLPEHALRQMAKEGKLPSIMCGNKVMINFDKLLAMLEGC